MGIGTLLRYLIGDKRAILEIAASRPALWVGVLFVLSAGFAREYDGEDLQHEPWHVLIPLGASLLSSFVLFMITYGKVVLNDPDRPSFFSAYRSFLTVFWMTAPLAWLYAIPYERFLTPYQAVAANLWTLGLVALWRVVLMVRVVSVLMGYKVVSATFLVMAFADAVSLLAIHLTPRPMFSIMGGIRLTESEQLILGLTCNLMCLGILSSPVWLIGALTVVANSKPAWQIPPGARADGTVPDRGLWALAATSVALWPFVLPWTQAEQGLRYRVEQDLRGGRIAEGLALMAAHTPDAFPPHWDPPPRVGYGEAVPSLVTVLEAVVEQPSAPWVRVIYVEKFRQFLGHGYNYGGIRGTEGSRVVRLLRRLPEGPALVAEHRDRLERIVESGFDLPQHDKDDLKTLLGISGERKVREPE